MVGEAITKIAVICVGMCGLIASPLRVDAEDVWYPMLDLSDADDTDLTPVIDNSPNPVAFPKDLNSFLGFKFGKQMPAGIPNEFANLTRHYVGLQPSFLAPCVNEDVTYCCSVEATAKTRTIISVSGRWSCRTRSAADVTREELCSELSRVYNKSFQHKEDNERTGDNVWRMDLSNGVSIHVGQSSDNSSHIVFVQCKKEEYVELVRREVSGLVAESLQLDPMPRDGETPKVINGIFGQTFGDTVPWVPQGGYHGGGSFCPRRQFLDFDYYYAESSPTSHGISAILAKWSKLKQPEALRQCWQNSCISLAILFGNPIAVNEGMVAWKIGDKLVAVSSSYEMAVVSIIVADETIFTASENRGTGSATGLENVPVENKYMVIDLNGGQFADRYPVTFLNEMPALGWTDEYKTTKLVLRRIPAGTFSMGSRTVLGEATPHRVTLTKDFYMGVFEVTQKQWELVMGSNPSEFKGDDRPVESVTYNAIRKGGYQANNSFMHRLREKTGITSMDLPTEAQWEWACRAGTIGDYSGNGRLDDMGWHSENSGKKTRRGAWKRTIMVSNGGQTHSVGMKFPNHWGLYDMHGNVQEWCRDWYGKYEGDTTDPEGPAKGETRVTRGGSWHDWGEENACSASRGAGNPRGVDQPNCVGFRLSCLPVPK